MTDQGLIKEIEGKSFYLIGIKGTGMAALAELLQSKGAKVSGSDVEEEFYTDKVLQALNIPYHRGFDPGRIDPGQWDYVVRSSAYPDDHPEVACFLKAGKAVMNYTQALGAFSARFDSSGVAGIHGKTTTTAIAGTLAKALKLESSVLVGSAASNFGYRSTWTGGDKYFIAETCEYQRHFLDFHPNRILLTSIEEDHLDYFKDIEDIYDAFLSYLNRLPQGGEVVYCADDAGAKEAIERISRERKDLKLTPYGKTATGKFQIVESSMTQGHNRFTLKGFDGEFRLAIPGEHLQLDAVGALALIDSLLRDSGQSLKERLEEARNAMADFRGTRRRSEIIGEAQGILVLDDYGHHPRAIDMTLKGYKAFYGNRRLVVDFMSHTYSRSAALLEDFARCFSAADCLILHDIYGSARESASQDLTGEDFYKKLAEHHREVYYYENIEQAKPFLRDFLKEGDIFLTLGAGNNWPLGPWVLEDRGDKHHD